MYFKPYGYMIYMISRSFRPRSSCLFARPVLRRALAPAASSKLVHIVASDWIEQRHLRTEADLHAFPSWALYPAKLEDGMYVRDGEEAVTQIEQLVDKGFYLVRGDPVVSRLEGWKDSMVAAGEAAAGRLAISYVESHFQAQDVCLLTSTGQLRSPNKKVTVGQVDAGAVVKGRLALLVSKKTRLLLDNVSQLYNTIVKIKRFRDKYDSLAEFRGLDLYGALVAEALPDDEDDRSLLLDEVRNYGFGLFERNGVEYSCSIKPGRKYGVCGEERAEF